MFRRLFLLSPLMFYGAASLSAEKSVKAALVYFSWYDNTFQEKIRPGDIDATTSASLQASGQVTQAARVIGQALGIEPIPIVVRAPYPVNYEDCLDQAIDEKTRKFRPALRSPENLPDFDVLFLGFPNWSYTLPMAVCTFLETHSTKGKTIAPFCVHGTGGLARTGRELRRCAPDAKILRTFSIYREDLDQSAAELRSWAQNIVERFRS